MKRFFFLIALSVTVGSQAQNQPIDTTKYDYVGFKIATTVYNGDPVYLNDLFDKDYLLKKVTRKSSDKYVVEFNKGFRKGLKQSFDLGDKMVSEIGEYGSYEFVKSRVNKKGEYHLLFRLYSNDEGLNYHDYKLRDKNGEVKIVDVYIFTTGEYLTKTFSDLYNATLSQRPNIVNKFLKNTIFDDLLKVRKLRDYMATGAYEDAYKLYNSLSSEGKKQKAIKLIGVLISGYLEDELYAKEIREFEALFPNDPSLFLVSIDGYTLSEEYDKALDQINLLDKSLGGDTFLNYLRSNLHYLMNDMPKSIECIELFLKNHSNMFDGYDVALTLYIESGKSKKAIEMLDIFINEFGVSKEDLKKSVKQNFPSFVNNSEYIAWSKK